MIWADRSQGERERAGKEMGQGTNLSSSEPQGQGVLEGPPGQRPANLGEPSANLGSGIFSTCGGSLWWALCQQCQPSLKKCL